MGNDQPNNAWHIATAVLAVLLGIAAADQLWARYQRHMMIKEFNRQVEAITAPGSDPLGIHAQIREHRKQEAEAKRRQEAARALKPDERCFDGQRFRRLENGWQQLPNQPC